MIRNNGILEMMRSISIFFLVLINVAAFGQDLELQLVKTFVGHEHGVNRVVFSPNGKLFASGDTRGGIRIWDLATESVLHAGNEHYGAILDLQFSNDGNRLVSSGADGRLLVWDVTSGSLISKIQSPVDPASGVNNVRFGKFGSDGSKVYFGGTNKYVCEKNVGDDSNGKVIHFEKEEIKCGVVSPDGSTVTVGVGKVLVSIDLETNKVSNEFNTGDCVINSVRYSSDGEKLLCWCANSRVDVRDPSSLMLKSSFRSGTGTRRFSNLFFSSDHRYVITGDHASRFNIWDLKTRQLILDQNTGQGTIMAFDMKYGPDMLLSASLDKTIKLWKIADVVEEPNKKRKNRKKPQEPAELIIVENTSLVRSSDPPVDEKSTIEVNEAPAKAPQPVVVDTPVDSVIEVEMKEPVSETSELIDSVIPVSKTIELVEVEPVDTVEVVNVDTVAVSQPVEMKSSSRQVFERIPERINGRRVVPVRKEHRLAFTNKKIEIKVWDDQVVDGDIISLFVNNEEILKNFSIKEKQHMVKFDAGAMDKCFIFLHAHNLGKIPPNTVTMTVSDGSQQYRIQLRSDLKGSASVELKFN